MRVLGIIMITVLIYCTSVYPAFESIDVSSEAIKVADAYTARVDGITSIYYNPAGLIGLEQREINFQYARWLTALDNDSLNYINFMFGYPFKHMKLGVSFNSFSSEIYSEQIISLAGSFNVYKLANKTIALGMRVKLLRILYEQTDYTLIDKLFINNGYNKSAISIDSGVLVYSDKGFSYGLSVKNINSPDISLENAGNNVPLQLRIGASHKWIFPKRFYSMNALIVGLDGDIKKTDYSAHLGIEPYFFDDVLIPGLGFGIGNKRLMYITAGIGYQLKIEGMNFKFKAISYLLKFNYAFKFNLGGMYRGTYGDHFISVSFRF